ncbi:T9SS type A sorting domain-containing protein [Bacteroidales bacterium OttesenSCG-928-A17]|nr:T9SS type A sorting domain-containing protein [Bacteroidales bacterium OttesenSCG-928-A17]
MHINNMLRGLLCGLVLFVLPTFAEAQTKLIVELLDFSETEYTIPDDGGFYFENDFLIIDDEGENDYSISIFSIRKISLQPPGTTGQNEIETPSFSVYPNPATDYVTVNTGIDGEQMLSIYSSSGILFLQNKCRTGETLDISSLPTGFYIVCLNGQSLKFCKL